MFVIIKCHNTIIFKKIFLQFCPQENEMKLLRSLISYLDEPNIFLKNFLILEVRHLQKFLKA